MGKTAARLSPAGPFHVRQRRRLTAGPAFWCLRCRAARHGGVGPSNGGRHAAWRTTWEARVAATGAEGWVA